MNLIPLRVLILEDSPADAEIMLHELHRAGFELVWKRVDTEADFLAALDARYDVILADHIMPQYDARRALGELRARNLDTPFIVVSGILSDKEAVAFIEQGAADYLLKDRLMRLGPAVKRVLAEKRLREEKLRAEVAQRGSEAQYRTLFETNPLPLWVFDLETLAFLAVNEAAVQHYGYSRDEFLNMTLKDIRPSDDVPTLMDHVQHIAAGFHEGDVWTHRKKDGTQILVEISANDISFGERPARLVIANDITERKRVEAGERDQRLLAEALRDATAALNSRLELDDILDTLFIHVGRVIRYDAASIMMLDGDIARVTSCRGFPDPEGILGFETPVEKIPYNAEIMVTGKPAIVYDTHQDSRWTVVEQSRWIRSHLSASIRTGEQVFGFLNLDSAHPNTFNPKQAEWLQAFADQAAIAIRNAQLLQTERKQRAQLEALRQASLDTTSQLALQPVLESILFYASRLMGADDTHIFLYDGQQLSFGAAIYDGSVQHKPMFLPRPEGVTYQVAHAGKLIAIEDINRHPLYQHWQWGGSIIALPLRSGSHVNGVMNLAFKTPHQFNERELGVLELFADQAALAVENAQLYERVQQYSEDLEQRIAERTAQLVQTKEQVEAIFNNSGDAIVLADMDGHIRQTNPAFNVQFGYQGDECYGELLSSLVRSDDCSTFSNTLLRLAGDKQQVEVEMKRKDGSTFDAEITMSRITGQFDIVCNLRDVSVRILAEKQIIQLNRTLEQRAIELQDALQHQKELVELKARLTALISHEFRTPLATILSSSDLLRTYGSRMQEEKKQDHFDAIQANIQHLNELINDVLLIGQAETVGITLNPTRLDMVPFCRAIVRDIQMLGAKHEIVFTADSEWLPAELDEKLMRRLVTNLLSNAVKYSPEGGKVRFDLMCDSAMLTIRIEDQGIGIPEKDRERLFAIFHRASNVGGISGSGLGLMIVKQVVEAHNGTILLESEEGIGTTFTVRLPVNGRG